MVVGFGMGHGLGTSHQWRATSCCPPKKFKGRIKKTSCMSFHFVIAGKFSFSDSKHKLFVNEGSSANPTPFVWNPHCIFTHILMHVKSHAPALKKYNIFSLATVWSHLTPFTSHHSPKPPNLGVHVSPNFKEKHRCLMSIRPNPRKNRNPSSKLDYKAQNITVFFGESIYDLRTATDATLAPQPRPNLPESDTTRFSP